MYLNKVTIVGNLTRDPEIKALPSGKKVTNFSVATNRKWKDANGQLQEAVEYHTVVLFGRLAETTAQHLSKGSHALIEGRLQTRSWDDTDTGKKMYRTEIIGSTVQFGRKKDAGNNQVQQQSTPQQPADEDINPEDIPF